MSTDVPVAAPRRLVSFTVDGEPVTVPEAVKHRPLADAGCGRHGLHCQRVRPLFGQQRSRGAQDALAIGGCVTAFAPLARHRKLAWLPEIAADC